MVTKNIPTRDEALALLHEYNKSDSLRKHAYSVEGVMRYCARKHGEDENKWGIIGLVHDLDYERFPDQHCTMSRKILEEHDWPDEYIRAVVSHGWGICSDVKPESVLEKTLFAIDEMTGLITANAMVRPSRSVMDMSVKSVRKKWKTPSFAAGVDRSIIQKGADMLGVEIGELIEDTINGMREVADDIGLKGDPVQDAGSDR